MVMGVLSSALDLAKAAVAHDEQGALPEKVLPYYKKVRGKHVVYGRTYEVQQIIFRTRTLLTLI